MMKNTKKDVTVKIDKKIIEAGYLITLIICAYVTISYNSVFVILTSILAYIYGRYEEKVKK